MWKKNLTWSVVALYLVLAMLGLAIFMDDIVEEVQGVDWGQTMFLALVWLTVAIGLAEAATLLLMICEYFFGPLDLEGGKEMAMDSYRTIVSDIGHASRSMLSLVGWKKPGSGGTAK